MSFIFPEHVTHGKLGSRGWNPNGYDIALHNRIRFQKYGEAMRSGRSSRLRPLRSLGLLFVRKGMLRAGAMRILPRLSHDSFVPEKLCTNRAPTCSSPISPGASPLCGVATSSIGWHAPGHGARPLSLHFGAAIPKCGCRQESGGDWWCQRALARVIGAKNYAAPVRSEFTEMFQALSSHSGM